MLVKASDYYVLYIVLYKMVTSFLLAIILKHDGIKAFVYRVKY